MPTIKLQQATDLTLILERNLWVLVKFSANWCEPCQRLESVFDSIVRQHTELQSVSVNVDLHPELTQNYAVRSVPTLLLFKQETIASQLSGLHNESRLSDWLNQHIKTTNE